MRPNCPIKIRLNTLPLFLLALCGGYSTLEAVDGQLQFSTYYDSNVREALTDPDPTLGLTLRGRLNHEIHPRRLNIFGEVLTQANLDAISREESKLIVNAELDFRYTLSQALNVLGNLSHFQKSFYNHTGSYLWTECSTFLHFSPKSRYSGWLGYRYRKKTLETTDRYRFGEDNLEFRGRYSINPRIFLEGTLTGSNVVHKDFNAVGVVDDTSLVFLEYPQKDKGIEGLIHVRYQGKIIAGVQIGIGIVGSNSVIGEFSFASYNAYISGNIGSKTFYHLVFRRIDKHYQYPELEGESWYRDPEEPVQNRTHFRLEQMLRGGSIGYLQISLLGNETIFNQRYYDKTMVEVGIKYDL
ncbi:MAG: hypothetical protein GH142_00045 [Dehalococcoidia bacterium]|nr:hypothetical protein [Dehalococcoidia bacterium]